MLIKLKNHKLIRPLIILLLLLVGLFVWTGCGRGLQPVGWSGFASGDGAIYTGSKEGRLVEINLTNLERRFSEPITTTSSGSFGCGGGTRVSPIYGTPVVAGGLIYVAGYNGEVHAYTANVSGSTLVERWVYPRKAVLKPIIGSLVLAGDTLYFGNSDHKVYGLDPQTGDKKFEVNTGGEIWSTPAVADNTLYIGSFDRKVYAFDIPSQSEKWQFVTGATNVAPPVASGDLVYVGSLDRKLYALRQSDGKVIWDYQAGNWFWARPVVHNGIVFAPNLDNHIYGFDAATGAKVFDYNSYTDGTGKQVQISGQFGSWPVIVGDQLVAATEDGKIFAASTDRNAQTIRLVDDLPRGVNVDSPLVAIGDVIYVNGSDNNLYRVNLTGGQSLSPISLKKT